MLAQMCKNGAAGCYIAMTAKEGMSHRLLEASQHSRSRNYDRKSDSQSPEQPEGAGGSQKEPGRAGARIDTCGLTETQCSCFNFAA